MKVITIRENRERTKQVRNKIVKTEKDITNLLVNADLNFKNIIFDEPNKKIYFDIEDDTFVLEVNIMKKESFMVKK